MYGNIIKLHKQTSPHAALYFIEDTVFAVLMTQKTTNKKFVYSSIQILHCNRAKNKREEN